jgi:hypothetical protein
MDEMHDLTRVAQLLDRLSGAQQGQAILNRLLQSDDLKVIARDIAASAAFERLYKEARTLEIKSSGRMEADPTFVGMPDLDPELAFDEQVDRFFFLSLARAQKASPLFFAPFQSPRRSY